MVQSFSARRTLLTTQRAWTAAHTPVPGVPAWARRVAVVVPLLVLPSSIWRITVGTFHAPLVDALPPDISGNLPSWLPLEVYVVLLSIASEIVAFSAVGLVASWGERFPRWTLFLRGRTVPVWFAVVPAAVGAAVLTSVCTWVAVMAALGLDVRGEQPTLRLLTLDTWQGALTVAVYAPLLAWGPLLGALTVAYGRRRRAHPQHADAHATRAASVRPGGSVVTPRGR